MKQYKKSLNVLIILMSYDNTDWGYAYTFFLYQKPSSRPSTESFLIFGHILVPKLLKVS